MSDSIDRACELEEKIRSDTIARHFAAAKLSQDKTPLPNGECRWCSAVAANDTVFCCEECAKDWQEQNTRKTKAQLIAGTAWR
jgi:predicted nucleic acid-binding Zn ribbon protein